MAFKMKNPSMAKLVKAAGDNRTAAKMKTESAMKMKKSSKGKSPMEKELKGKQHNLPDELKAKIEAAPSKMKKGSAVKRRDIPTASELDRMESEGRYITKANPDSDKAPEKDSEGNTKMYLAAGFDDMTKLTDSEGNMYVDTKNMHTVTDEKNPGKRNVAKEKQVGEGGKPSNLTRFANQTTRSKYDPETGKKLTKAKTEGGDSAAPFLGKKSHAEKMERIGKRGQKKVDRITGKAKEDRKAKKAQNKITRAGERGQAKDDRKRLAEARKSGRDAAKAARKTEKIDRKSTRLQGKEDRAIARADKKIKKQEGKKQKAMDKNYKKMNKLVG